MGRNFHIFYISGLDTYELPLPHTTALAQGMNCYYPLNKMTHGPGSWSGLKRKVMEAASSLKNIANHPPHYNMPSQARTFTTMKT